MIGRLRGLLVEKAPPDVLIEIGGVGYEVQMPMTSFYQLPETGQEATIYTHFVVREDAQLLFGFADKFERTLFRELIKANGVGPKLALTILSGMSAPQLMHSVTIEDVTALVKLPGVGKKTAERLVVELKDRFAKLEQLNTMLPTGDIDVSAPAAPQIVEDDARSEAHSALTALGYKPAQASKMLDAIYQPELSSEALIREALRSAAS
ncbi:Holliday junction branch migration protein RuvA [Aestuariibacter salexigens]|uniref:Holliday junction branch migration protein RuvA n=1 Tax=Aestuariibacter salexigens TaxID=226010 RepID=UPI0004012BCD|nr:Holliday junction branch migration protein RuvA [Aestuariibacter salexigens]